MKNTSLSDLVDESAQWGPTEWWRLEIRSFASVPNTQRSLAVLASRDAWPKELNGSVLGLLTSLMYAFSLVGPAVGAYLMVRWYASGSSGSMPLEVAGLLTFISALIVLVTDFRSRKRPRSINLVILFRLAIVHLIPAIATTTIVIISVPTARYNAETDPSLWWLLAVALDASIYVRYLIRRNKKDGPQNLFDNLQLSVSEIDPDKRATILENRNEAIERLRSQSKIDSETANRARTTHLGLLALTVAPEGISPAYPPAVAMAAAAQGLEPPVAPPA